MQQAQKAECRPGPWAFKHSDGIVRYFKPWINFLLNQARVYLPGENGHWSGSVIIVASRSHPAHTAAGVPRDEDLVNQPQDTVSLPFQEGFADCREQRHELRNQL